MFQYPIKKLRKILPVFFIIVLTVYRGSFAQTRQIIIKGFDKMKYSVERIEAEPGEELKIVMVTISEMPKAAMAHNFVLLKKGKDAARFANESAKHKIDGYIDPEMTEWILAKTDMVGGGNRDSVTFNAPSEPGEYQYVCTFPGHFNAGMKGVLIVK